MAKVADSTSVYAAAERWVKDALPNDGSLFTPGRSIWTLDVIADFRKRFVDLPEASKDSFMSQFEQQIAGAGTATVQLAAELLYVHFLIANQHTMGGDTKRDRIRQVLGWADLTIPIDGDLDEALDGRILNPGPFFLVNQPFQIELLAEFARKWKQLRPDRQAHALTDPWAFKDIVSSIDVPHAHPQEAALLHLVHPDTFEPIVSKNHRNLIVKTFADRLDKKSDDVDRNLYAIRKQLSGTHGDDFHFYASELRSQWNPNRSGDPSKWDPFIHWARRFVEHPDFDKEERDYKIEISQNLRKARSAVEADADDWVAVLRRAFGPPSNLVHYITFGRLIEWCGEDRSAARAALLEFWSAENGIDEAIRTFLGRISSSDISGPGTKTNLASFLTMAIDPGRYPPYRVGGFTKGYELTGYPPPDDGADEASTYLYALDFLDNLIQEASTRGLTLRDRLDAQGALWAVASSGWYADTLPEEEREAFLSYRGGTEPEPPPPETPEVPAPAQTLQDIADKLRWRVSHLQEIERLLEDKRQVVFYGPPGTGKTYVAQELAEYFAGEHGSLDLVQFHPSYAYEDFIEGFRPALVDGQPGFELKDGPLKRIADRARSEPNAKHVLVIDEINRGNLAKVFGELYFLLEYRDREISLQYADQPFTLPENLWIIATMNTADRSIALVDAALRRRFFFVPFFPDEPPVEGLLRRWLLEEKPTMLWVADVVDAANQILKDLDKRDMAVGPSYFMNKKLNEEWVRRIWKHSILPYVEEQLFGQTDRIGEFELPKLRAAVQRSTGAEEEPATANGQADAAPEPGDA